MYIFIIIIFIAELIIAQKIISVIVNLDKKVCDINDCVTEFNPLAKTFMRYINIKVSSVCEKVSTVTECINKQKNKTIVKIFIIIALNLSLIIFNLKKTKAKKFVNLAVAIFDIVSDFTA